MTTRYTHKVIRDERDARSAPIGSRADLNGERLTKVDDDAWEDDDGILRPDAEMLGGRLRVVKP